MFFPSENSFEKTEKKCSSKCVISVYFLKLHPTENGDKVLIAKYFASLAVQIFFYLVFILHGGNQGTNVGTPFEDQASTYKWLKKRVSHISSHPSKIDTNQNNLITGEDSHDLESLFDWSKGFQDLLKMGISPYLFSFQFFVAWSFLKG